METRQITETKVYYLVGNDMRGKAENLKAFACSFSRENLEKYLQDNTEAWRDEKASPDFYGNTHGYGKAYKKGSFIEWSNGGMEIEENWESADLEYIKNNQNWV